MTNILQSPIKEESIFALQRYTPEPELSNNEIINPTVIKKEIFLIPLYRRNIIVQDQEFNEIPVYLLSLFTIFFPPIGFLYLCMYFTFFKSENPGLNEKKAILFLLLISTLSLLIYIILLV